MKVIAIVSAKGGVGKTTVCANLSAALVYQGCSVLNIDLDPQNALRFHSGVDLENIEGISRAALRGQPLHEACVTLASGAVLLPYGLVNEDDRQAFEEILAKDPDWLVRSLESLGLADEAIVVLDTPPGPSVYMKQALTAANLVLVVTLADAASYATLPMIEGLIETYCHERPGFIDYAFIINQVNQTRQLSKDVTVTMQTNLGYRVVSLLHQDQAVSEALAYNQNVLEYDPHCQATSDFLHTAQWVIEALAVKEA